MKILSFFPVSPVYKAKESPLVNSDFCRRCVFTLAKIYGHTHLLPSSYLLSDVVEKVHEKPLHFGEYTETWEGTYNGRAVAIKTFKASHRDDDETIRTVNKYSPKSLSTNTNTNL